MTLETRQEIIKRAAAGLAETLTAGHVHAAVYLAELIRTDQEQGALFLYAQRLARELGGLDANEVYRAMLRAATFHTEQEGVDFEQGAAQMERNAMTWGDLEDYRYKGE